MSLYVISKQIDSDIREEAYFASYIKDNYPNDPVQIKASIYNLKKLKRFRKYLQKRLKQEQQRQIPSDSEGAH